MTTPHRESAKIYDIFSGKRILAPAEREVVRPSGGAFERTPEALAATGWYHDAAIEESTPDQRRHLPN
jgi:hypothetical protein